MDLHERRELDMSAQVARVKAKARPWRSIIALFLALCGLAAGEFGRYSRHLDPPTGTLLKYAGAAVFLVFGLVAAFGLSGQARDLLRPAIGAAHAGVARYALVLAGIFTVLVITLNIANVPVGQLVLGGAVTGVLLGIAAQQSLANLFAGMVLLFARPFRVGDRVRFRAGALAGLLDGTVTDISIAYVRLETPDGLVFVPNSQALAACVGPLPPPEPDPEPPAAAGPAHRDAAAEPSPVPGSGAVPRDGAAPGPGTASGDGTAPPDGTASRDGTPSGNGAVPRD
ncbi:MAG TPA: mechanosensitive ion channel domain-containing protein [Streptosporangiaceae bacterium]